MYFPVSMYANVRLASSLQKELKAVDDKTLQAELHLVESRTYYTLSNVQKARGSLTAARTATSGIYCPPKLQADFDLQAGLYPFVPFIHFTISFDFQILSVFGSTHR